MLGELEAKSGRIVVADLEAGVGTISRLQRGNVDRLLLVAEPSAKSLEVAKRALEIAREVEIDDVSVVASRVSDHDDVARIKESLPGVPLLCVPEDPSVRDADRIGVAPIDHAPHSPAMTAIRDIADALGR